MDGSTKSAVRRTHAAIMPGASLMLLNGLAVNMDEVDLFGEDCQHSHHELYSEWL